MPIKFCPHCDKLLKQHKEGEQPFLRCETCGYEIDAPKTEVRPKKGNKAILEKKIAQNKTLVMDRAAALKSVPEHPTVMCFRCKSHRIEFIQLQTRRADEPMTTFFRCANCGNRWRG